MASTAEAIHGLKLITALNLFVTQPARAKAKILYLRRDKSVELEQLFLG